MITSKTVLVTGASTGIGYATAKYLAQHNYKVYAGVRKQQDEDILNNLGLANLKAILLDVTSDDSINRAASEIAEQENGELHCLINNAGVGYGGALEMMSAQDIHDVINVNVIGLMEATQTFIPMLRKAKGKIINIGSTANFLSSPGGSVYSASKFAVRAFTDSLRRELHPFGVDVVLIAPGAVESEIWNKSIAQKEKMRKMIEPHLADLYSPLIKYGEQMATELKKIPAELVAQLILNVLNERNVKPIYTAGKDAAAARKVSRLPAKLLDMIFCKRIEKAVGK